MQMDAPTGYGRNTPTSAIFEKGLNQMPHCLILKAVSKWPEHWQKAFEELRITMGMENAYYRIRQLKGGM